MKKVICLFSAFLLLLSSAMTTYVHETDSQDYLSIPSYNETYSAHPTDNNFLSLKEYNTEYSNGENPLKIDSPLTTQNVPDICYFPYPKTGKKHCFSKSTGTSWNYHIAISNRSSGW